MNEKDTALLSDDYGRDLASVQALQRKHEGLERDLAALEDKVCPSLHLLHPAPTFPLLSSMFPYFPPPPHPPSLPPSLFSIGGHTGRQG